VCRCSWDFAPALFSCMGFVVGIMWVDTIASEVRASVLK
jgi:hypothetical protein